MTEEIQTTAETGAAASLFARGRAELGKVISGQLELIDQALLTLLCADTSH